MLRRFDQRASFTSRGGVTAIGDITGRYRAPALGRSGESRPGRSAQGPYRHGCSRRRRSERRQSYRRYEWAQPGALLHIDAKQLPRFERPGHYAHGDRADRNRGLGSSWVISVVDDRSRLAYSELHSGEQRWSVRVHAAPGRRALRRAWLRGRRRRSCPTTTGPTPATSSKPS